MPPISELAFWPIKTPPVDRFSANDAKFPPEMPRKMRVTLTRARSSYSQTLPPWSNVP